MPAGASQAAGSGAGITAIDECGIIERASLEALIAARRTLDRTRNAVAFHFLVLPHIAGVFAAQVHRAATARALLLVLSPVLLSPLLCICRAAPQGRAKESTSCRAERRPARRRLAPADAARQVIKGVGVHVLHVLPQGGWPCARSAAACRARQHSATTRPPRKHRLRVVHLMAECDRMYCQV